MLSVELDKMINEDVNGDNDDEVLEEVLSRIEEVAVDEEAHTAREFKETAGNLKKAAQLGVSKISSLRDNTEGQKISLAQLARKMREEARSVNSRENVFTILGNELGDHIMSKAPKYSYIRPVLENNDANATQMRQRRTIRKRETRAKENPLNVRGKTTRQAQENTNVDSSIAKELDALRKVIRTEIHNSPDRSIDYYRFVLHPTNFGETIENMFYTSFLVKDAFIGLVIDAQSGMPVIKKLSKEQRQQMHVDNRSEMETSQAVSKITYTVWKKLVATLCIKESMIKRIQQQGDEDEDELL